MGMALIAGCLMGFDAILHPPGARIENAGDETRRKKDAKSGGRWTAKASRVCKKSPHYATIVTSKKGERGMKRKLGLTAALLLMALAAPAMAQKVTGLDGDWNGTIVTPDGHSLRALVHIESTAKATSATFTSLDQNNAQIPVAAVTRKGKDVMLDLPIAHASYKGTLAGNPLTGTWTQGSASLPLNFVRQAAAKPAKKK